MTVSLTNMNFLFLLALSKERSPFIPICSQSNNCGRLWKMFDRQRVPIKSMFASRLSVVYLALKIWNRPLSNKMKKTLFANSKLHWGYSWLPLDSDDGALNDIFKLFAWSMACEREKVFFLNSFGRTLLEFFNSANRLAKMVSKWFFTRFSPTESPSFLPIFRRFWAALDQGNRKFSTDPFISLPTVAWPFAIFWTPGHRQGAFQFRIC